MGAGLPNEVLMDRHAANNRPMIAVVMGVSGSGKTTIATRFAAELGWPRPRPLPAPGRARNRQLAGQGPVRSADLLGAEAILSRHHHRWSPDLLRSRLAARRGHFMPPALLDSQFATLQEPSPVENAIVVEVSGQPAEIVRHIAHRQRRFDSQGSGCNDPR
jgi:gluconokinase